MRNVIKGEKIILLVLGSQVCLVGKGTPVGPSHLISVR